MQVSFGDEGQEADAQVPLTRIGMGKVISLSLIKFSLGNSGSRMTKIVSMGFSRDLPGEGLRDSLGNSTNLGCK